MHDIFSLYGRIFDFAIPWVKKFRYNTDAVTANHIGAECRLWCYWWIDQCFCFFKCRIVLLYVYVCEAFRWKIINHVSLHKIKHQYWWHSGLILFIWGVNMCQGHQISIQYASGTTMSTKDPTRRWWIGVSLMVFLMSQRPGIWNMKPQGHQLSIQNGSGTTMSSKDPTRRWWIGVSLMGFLTS